MEKYTHIIKIIVNNKLTNTQIAITERTLSFIEITANTEIEVLDNGEPLKTYILNKLKFIISSIPEFKTDADK